MSCAVLCLPVLPCCVSCRSGGLSKAARDAASSSREWFDVSAVQGVGGETISLPDYEGKYLAIHFGTSW